MEISMKTLAGIIIVITLLAVGMIVFFLYFMPVEWEITLLLLVLKIETFIRGNMISLLWKVVAIVMAVAAAYLLIMGRKMLSNPITAAILAGVIAGVEGFILYEAYAVQGAIPWFDIKLPTLELGQKKAIEADKLKDKTVEMTLDCWYAFQANRYDPLAGVSGYHPRRCATIHFNLTKSVDFGKLEDNIKSYYLPGPGSAVVEGVLGQKYKVYKSYNKVLGYVKVTKYNQLFNISFYNKTCNFWNGGIVELGKPFVICGTNFTIVDFDGKSHYRLIIGDAIPLNKTVNVQFHNFESTTCQEGYIFIEYGDCGGYGAHGWYSPSCGIDGDNDVNCSKGDFVILCLECPPKP